mmetsp:Transcript_1369/g.4043  ORF Transcript_1369/g.4043 Transcript_1369/m.4043 type:complete len:460 (+) Transcript_1369:1049-2428(+)
MHARWLLCQLLLLLQRVGAAVGPRWCHRRDGRLLSSKGRGRDDEVADDCEHHSNSRDPADDLAHEVVLPVRIVVVLQLLLVLLDQDDSHSVGQLVQQGQRAVHKGARLDTSADQVSLHGHRGDHDGGIAKPKQHRGCIHKAARPLVKHLHHAACSQHQHSPKQVCSTPLKATVDALDDQRRRKAREVHKQWDNGQRQGRHVQRVDQVEGNVRLGHVHHQARAHVDEAHLVKQRHREPVLPSCATSRAGPGSAGRGPDGTQLRLPFDGGVSGPAADAKRLGAGPVFHITLISATVFAIVVDIVMVLIGRWLLGPQEEHYGADSAHSGCERTQQVELEGGLLTPRVHQSEQAEKGDEHDHVGKDGGRVACAVEHEPRVWATRQLRHEGHVRDLHGCPSEIEQRGSDAVVDHQHHVRRVVCCKLGHADRKHERKTHCDHEGATSVPDLPLSQPDAWEPLGLV